ncbi:MAG: Na+/H+ antiporter NhaC family protein [Thermoanaerobaculia bacterium]
MPTHDDRAREPLGFHGGLIGALLPFVVLFVGIIWLGLAGAPDERGFWPLLLLGLVLGMGLARDRYRYSEVIVAGMSQPLVALMIMAWVLAGILGTVMNATGFVDSLVWLSEAAGVSGAGYAIGAFLICCLVSTSTGTSLGTILLCAPLLYPAGGALGTSPGVLMGAIIGGATFGDNISPVSDTTIASASTQGAEIGAVVRSRMRYALPAAALAMVLYGVSGSGGEVPALGEAVDVPAAAAVAADRGPVALPMLAVPAIVIGLLLAKRHLLEGLFVGAVLASLMALALGLVEPASLFFVDAERFTARGLLIDGIERAVGVSIFTIFLMGMVAGLEAAGVMERLVALAERNTRGASGAEAWSFATVSAAALLTTHSVVALLAVGPFTRRVGGRFGLDACRRANILDATVCTWPFLLPYCIPTILAASTSAAGEAVGMPRVSPLEAGMWNFHSWALLAVVLFAIATGYGRGRSTTEAPDRSSAPNPSS